MGKSFMSIMNDIVMKNLRNLLHIIENTVMKFWHNHEIQVWNYGGLQKKSELFRSPRFLETRLPNAKTLQSPFLTHPDKNLSKGFWITPLDEKVRADKKFEWSYWRLFWTLTVSKCTNSTLRPYRIPIQDLPRTCRSYSSTCDYKFT